MGGGKQLKMPEMDQQSAVDAPNLRTARNSSSLTTGKTMSKLGMYSTNLPPGPVKGLCLNSPAENRDPGMMMTFLNTNLSNLNKFDTKFDLDKIMKKAD